MFQVQVQNGLPYVYMLTGCKKYALDICVFKSDYWIILYLE